MADREIPDLTAATTPLTGAEEVHISQGGNSRRATLSDVAAIATGAMLKVDYDPDANGIIAVAQGGTNAATASGARTNLGLGTMAVQGAAAVAITGGSITGITDLTVADGGTGASDASGARTNLGLAIGSDVQAYSANLAGFAATTVANVQNRDNHTGTQLASTISDFNTAADLRITAAVGVSVQAYDALLSSVSGLSLTAGDIIYATGPDAVASLPVGAAGQVLAVNGSGTPAWDTSLVVGGLIAANNLSDVANASTALTNLGVSAFAKTILDDATADAALTTLGFGAAGKAIAADANITVATAQAYSPVAAPDYIRTAGYAAAGDSGGALYKKVVAEPAHAGKFSITLSGGGGTVWYELAEKIITPQMFGAPADGVSTDDTAFQAIAAAVSAGFFRYVRIPAGEYYLNSATRVDINGAPDGVAVVGDGWPVTHITTGASANARPFVIRNTDGVLLKGIHFENLDQVAPRNNVDIMNCNQATIEDNKFNAATFYGLGCYQDTIASVDGTMDDLVVRRNIFVDSGTFGFEHFPKVLSNGLECYENIFINCGQDQAGFGGDPAAMKPGQATRNSRIYNNKIYGAAGAGGIWMGNYEDIECFGNELYDVPDVGISLSAAAHPHPYSGEYRSAIIRDNVFVATAGFTRNEPMIGVSADAAAVLVMGPVVIQQNTIINDTATYSIRVQTIGAIPRLQIIDNYWDSEQAVFVPIMMSNASGAAPVKPLIKGNRLINRNLTATVFRIEVTGAVDPKIIGNYIANGGNQAISLSSCTGSEIVIDDNIIDGYNVANTASVAAVNITDAAANTYYIRNNKLLANNGNAKAFLNVGTVPTIVMHGNRPYSDAVPLILSGTPTILANATTPFLNFGRNRVFFGTAAPVAGAHSQGDVVVNTAPSASGNWGWVCTVGGTPGTWKTFGTIAA